MRLAKRSRLLHVIFLFSLFGGWGPRGFAAESPIEIAHDEKRVTIRCSDRPALEYVFSDVPYKPYVRRLHTPTGLNVLRDAPHDHLHHHALMFAIGVNGVDFWGEQDTAGRQQHVSIDLAHGAKNKLGPCPSFTEKVDWVNPATKEPLLQETRTLSMQTGPVVKATLLTWRSQLRVPEGGAKVTLDGRHYFGLGMRFVESMDKGGLFFNADAKPGKTYRGDEKLVQSRWCAYAAAIDAKPVTVVMFDLPGNVREATWFTMATPFAYLSATLALHEEPLILETDKDLVLTYGVAVYGGSPTANEVESLYLAWAAALKNGNALRPDVIR